MSVVGPRPLLVQYLPLYNEHQARRHEVRPGFTGYAQVHGRNAITWNDPVNMTSGHKIAAVIRCRNHLTLEITEQASASFLKTLLGVISNAQ